MLNVQSDAIAKTIMPAPLASCGHRRDHRRLAFAVRYVCGAGPGRRGYAEA
jgi:hypothetical protein